MRYYLMKVWITWCNLKDVRNGSSEVNAIHTGFESALNVDNLLYYEKNFFGTLTLTSVTYKPASLIDDT